MRLLMLPVAATLMSGPSSAFAPTAEAVPAPAPAVERPRAVEQMISDDCRRTSRHYADADSVYRGEPLTPRKLDDLPDATAYMAVMRRDANGCEDPLTVIEYRQGDRR